MITLMECLQIGLLFLWGEALGRGYSEICAMFVTY